MITLYNFTGASNKEILIFLEKMKMKKNTAVSLKMSCDEGPNISAVIDLKLHLHKVQYYLWFAVEVNLLEKTS